MGFPGEYGNTPELPEAAFSYTMKDARGDLLSVRGADFDAFFANAASIVGPDRLESVLEEVRHRIDTQPQQGASQASSGSRPGNSGAQSSGPQNRSQPSGGGGGGMTPADRNNGGDWKANAPYCEHGQRRAQEWTAKSGPQKGQTQYTYFCPQPREVPRDQKCNPIDALDGKEWG